MNGCGPVAMAGVLALGVAVRTAAQDAGLDGGPRAVAAAERLLAGLGGREAWARARTVAVELRGYYAPDSLPWVERYWIDLVVPRGRYEIRTGRAERVIAWTAAGGWESRDGVVEGQSPERHKLEQAYWTSELTVVFRRLAAGTPRTTVTLDSTSAGLWTLTLRDAASRDSVAQFTLNAAGEPIRWSARINDEPFDRILGPLADYERVRVPKWGATPSGEWRYEHLRVTLSPEPPRVSFERPR
jgi:hypothetical protein